MKKYNKWATLFGGYLGLHKYMAGEIGMGLLYTFTIGLFGFGWLIDIFKAFSNKEVTKSNSRFYLPLKKLPIIQPTGLVLRDGELCHYQGSASTEKVFDRVAGYVSQHSGGSIRIAKGLSIHTGGGGRQTVRESVTETAHGMLYITNERIIFLSVKNAFDKLLSSLTAYTPSQGHIIFLFGNQSYDLVTSDCFRIKDIIDGIMNGMPIEY